MKTKIQKEDEKYFLRGLNSEKLVKKLKKHSISPQKLINLPKNIMQAIIDSGNDLEDAEVVDYISWFRKKILKQAQTTQITQIACQSAKKLSEFVEGCGKNIPNNITNERQCFTWWFANGNWQASKNYKWRVGCNWGGNGTQCGKKYSDGSNYCKSCGEEIQKLLKL